MIRQLRQRIFPLVLHSLSRAPGLHIPSPLVSLRSYLSTTASTISPKPFAVEDYLVATCGLSRTQALKASKKISHLKSPSNPDAVLAFLAGLGVPRADVATIVAADPWFLCASVERTLAPRVAELSDLGLSGPEIARFIPVATYSFRRYSLSRTVNFWLPVFGSFDKLLRGIRNNCRMFTVDFNNVAKPNLDFLQQCGVSACEIAGSSALYANRLLTMKPDCLREAAKRVEELGINRSSPMFRYALCLVAFMSKQDVANKIGILKKVGFSQHHVSEIVRKAPTILGASEDRIHRVIDFWMRDVGLELQYIAQRPALIMYSVQRRLLPRHRLLNVLREKGLRNLELNYYTAAMGEKTFVEKFVTPYKDIVPGLAEDYGSGRSSMSRLLVKEC
jgi:mTERF domain-containing protein